MTREIKFRGRKLNSNEWVYGVPHTYGDGTFIAEMDLKSNNGNNWRCIASEIYPKTIGQFTGLKDRNGAEIWEGDLVRPFFEGEEYPDILYRVEFEESGYVYYHHNGQKDWRGNDSRWGPISKTGGKISFAVIGNIHEGKGGGANG